MPTKPHEETWCAHKDCVVMVSGWLTIFIPHLDDMGEGEDANRARAQLAAQAPAMARLLLSLEWSGKQDYVGDGGYACCPQCLGVAPENESLSDAVNDIAKGRTVAGHQVDCTLVGTLRAAGVLP